MRDVGPVKRDLPNRDVPNRDVPNKRDVSNKVGRACASKEGGRPSGARAPPPSPPPPNICGLVLQPNTFNSCNRCFRYAQQL